MNKRKTIIIFILLFILTLLIKLLIQVEDRIITHLEPVKSFYSGNVKLEILLIIIGVLSLAFYSLKSTNSENSETLLKEAMTDNLTGLYNRRAAMRILEKLYNHKNFTLYFIDLDGLKNINDSFGHKQGDLFIKEFADITRSTLRRSDYVCRLGGDEFLLIFTDIPPEKSHLSIKRIYQKIESKKDKHFNFSFSVGFETYKVGDKKTIDEIIKSADKNMYIMKKAKKSK